MPVVLHVGCGPKDLRALPDSFQDGSWSEIRLDVDAGVKPDIVSTMTDMSAIATGSVHAIFSSHNIEHLFSHDVPTALVEFKRVLEPSGFAMITCPDLQEVARYVAEDRLLDTLYTSTRGPITPLDIFYGHRASIADGNAFMAHRGGFTARTLANALREAGFPQVATKRRRAHFDLWSLALPTSATEDAFRRRAEALLPR